MSQDRDPKTPQPESTKTPAADAKTKTSTEPTPAQNVIKIKTKSEPQDKKPETQPTTKPQDKKSKDQPEKPLKEVFILARPFVAFGRYLRDSWRELRQVRWPNRANTWKLVLAVFIYCAIFLAFIIVLDTFFTFIFNLLLGVH